MEQSFVWGCFKGIQHISEGSKYKSNCCKNGNYNKPYGCLGEEEMIDHCRIARSTLRLSSSKNEGGSVYLCQNSVAFMLPTTTTTVAPVECTLVTMFALGSVSVALILLSPSSDFIAKCFFACVNQLKVTCFQLEWKRRRRKEVNFWLVGFEIQLLEMTFKPVNIVDRNVVRQAVCFARKIQALIRKLCFSGAVTCWKPTPMPSPFTRASWPCLSSSTFPWLLLWTPASTPKVMQSLAQLHMYTLVVSVVLYCDY